jgi:hypothetical protein
MQPQRGRRRTHPDAASPRLVLPISECSCEPADQLLITIAPDANPHVQLFQPGKSPLATSSPSLRYPIILYPLGKEDYYTVKGGINILGLFKSPIVLMMLFSGGMMYALPKLMVRTSAFALTLGKRRGGPGNEARNGGDAPADDGKAERDCRIVSCALAVLMQSHEHAQGRARARDSRVGTRRQTAQVMHVLRVCEFDLALGGLAAGYKLLTVPAPLP